MICSGTGGKEIIIVIEAAGQKGERGRETVGAWAGGVSGFMVHVLVMDQKC